MAVYKRYQYWTRNGIQWSEWFDYDGPQYKYQLNSRLRNEYMIEEDDEEDEDA